MVTSPRATQGTITLDLAEPMKQVTIRTFSLNGSLVSIESHELLTKRSIHIAGEGGLYIISVESEGQLVKTQRVYKK